MVFSLVSIDPPSAVTAEAHGSVVIASSSDVSVRAHDNPAAVLMHKSMGAGLNVEYSLGPGITASKTDDRTATLSGLGGRIWAAGNGTISVNDTKVSVSLQANSQAMFRASPGRPGETAEPAAELAVIARQDAWVADIESYTPDLGVDVSEASQGRVSVHLTSSNPRGKVVSVSFDKETMPSIRVLLDGVELFRAPDLSSRDRATYAVGETSGAVHVYAYVDHFSARALTVESASQGGLPGGSLSGIPVLYLLAGTLVAAVAIAVIIASRRGRKGQ
jgi:hypothetical protein